MTEDETREMQIEARQFYLAAPVVLPLIARRKKTAFERLMLAHKEGKTDYLALVAELNVLNDLEREFVNKEQTYRSMEDKNANRK